MRNRALLRAVTLGVAAVLAACGGDGTDEARARAESEDGPTGSAPQTPVVSEVARPGEPTEMIQLRPVGQGTVHGEAVITALPAQTRIGLAVQAAPPDSILAAYIGVGTCLNPGPVAAQLAPVPIDTAGRGEIRAEVEIAPHNLLNGQHYLQVHRGDVQRRIPLACGDLPARIDLQPGGRR